MIRATVQYPWSALLGGLVAMFVIFMSGPLFTLGRASRPAAEVLLVWVMLAFPSGRLTGRRERALVALDEVGLSARSGLRPAEMSGGEKQRVSIARALAKNPKLLFADEPTSALDAANGQMVIDLLHRLARTHGAAVLCVSHDPRVVAHADRVLHMEDGRLLDDTRPGASKGPR